MKASLKLPDDHHKNHRIPPLLLRAKIPITIFSLPFLSHFSTTTTTHPSQLSLALSTNFSTGPSLKLSYAAVAAADADAPPFTLTLKSGTGLFGSPKNSPLIISAHFSFNPSNPNNPNPTFSLLFKPQLGSFSLRKSTFSHSKTDVTNESTNGDSGFDSNSFGFVPLERPEGVKNLLVQKNDKDSIFKGVQLTADTRMPIVKRTALNFRWWMDFPVDKMPILRINKIGIERVEEVVKEDDERKKKIEGSNGEVEMLKGMCYWMQKELDSLTRVNREMKSELAEIKAGRVVKNSGAMEFKEGDRKKAEPAVGSTSGGFEQWRSKKNNVGNSNGNTNERNEESKNGSLAFDVENELQRAIKAAAS